MPTINMRSSANLVKGQGVGSAYDEQVRLVKYGLTPEFNVFENQKGDYDILHYHTVNLNYFFERLFKKNKSVSVGYVHFLPETVDNSLKLPKIAKKVFYKYLLAFYNSMDYLVTVNPSVIEQIKKAGINKPQLRFIPNFVSSENFYVKSPEEIVQIKKRFDIPQDKFIALGVGQLQTRKGIVDFIKTAETCPDMQFVWAGGFSFGIITDGYEEIKTYVENPPKNVRFLGIVERALMPDIYNMSDVLFLPSFDELFPMTILEAICCKKPLLLRDIDIYKDILFDYYLKAADNNGFADILTCLCRDADYYKKASDASWECHQVYGEESVLKMWNDLYSQAYNSLKEHTAVKNI